MPIAASRIATRALWEDQDQAALGKDRAGRLQRLGVRCTAPHRERTQPREHPAQRPPYGAAARHGGGAFSGKDPSKLDRSGAYAARWVAVNIVAAGLAQRCELQVAYAIGLAEPVSVMVETFGTCAVSEERLVAAVRAVFDLRPTAIREALALDRPIYRPLAAYGHFGRTDLQLPWEQPNRVEELQASVRYADELST
jgi:hypothetical protein